MENIGQILKCLVELFWGLRRDWGISGKSKDNTSILRE